MELTTANEFFLSKGKETKIYIWKIFEYLCDEMERHPESDGWVRSRDLFAALVKTGEIPHSTQFFRILDDLCKIHLVEKKLDKPGVKGPVYYRVPELYPVYWFASREDLVKSHESLYEIVINQAFQLEVAKILLKGCHPEADYDPDVAIDDLLKSRIGTIDAHKIVKKQVMKYGKDKVDVMAGLIDTLQKQFFYQYKIPRDADGRALDTKEEGFSDSGWP